MENHRTLLRWGSKTGLWIVAAVLVVGAVGTVVVRPAVAEPSNAASLQVSITVTPSPVPAGSSFSVSASVMGGSGPFTFNWNQAPYGCNPSPNPSWSCSLSSPGNYTVGVMVSNGTADGSATQNFTVTGSGNNGNQGSSNSNSNNNNGSNGFNLSAFGPVLIYALIGGLIGFALLVALTIGVIMIAVILSRRLPKPPKGGLVCPACQAAAPAGANFCPACAAPLGPPKK